MNGLLGVEIILHGGLKEKEMDGNTLGNSKFDN